MQKDYRLGDWLVQAQRGCIERGEKVVHLKPKVMAVLDCLAAANGDVVKRDDLFETVWPGQVVSDATLTQCVVELRQAFGDSAKDPRVIETIPKVGFRLIPAVSLVEGGTPGDSAGRSLASVRWPFILAGILAVLFITVVWFTPENQEPQPSVEDPTGRSLAVLPFNDVSPDGQQGWVAASLTEQLINRLSRLEGLEVIGKTAAFTLDNGQADLKAVARELGVDFIVEGSVFRADEDIRINTRLVEIGTAKTWWAYEWTPTLDEFLTMQEIIAEGVAIALSIELDVGELGLDPNGPNDVEAFWSMDSAMRSLAFDTRESWLEAVREIENTVERDPEYAMGWLVASFIYSMAQYRISDIIHRDWRTLRENALDRALELASDTPEALATLVNMYAERGEFAAAEQAIAKAGPLESVSDPLLLFQVGIARNHVGRTREALQLAERAQLLDPEQLAHFKRVLALAYLENGRTGDALAMYESAWGNDDVMRSTCSHEGVHAALVDGDTRLVLKWLIRAQEFNEAGRLRFFQAMETHLGDQPAALAFLREAHENPYEDVQDQFIAFWAAYYGDHELALDAILKTQTSWWLWNPLLAPIRNDPRIRDMMGDLGLEDYWREYAWPDFCRPIGDEHFECE